jgi:hypothetical protein
MDDAKLREVFGYYDVHGTGSLSLENLGFALLEVGVDLDEKGVQREFGSSLDFDGTMSREGFVRSVRKYLFERERTAVIPESSNSVSEGTSEDCEEPSGVAAQQWQCPQCSELNLPAAMKCCRCGEANPAQARAAETARQIVAARMSMEFFLFQQSQQAPPSDLFLASSAGSASSQPKPPSTSKATDEVNGANSSDDGASFINVSRTGSVRIFGASVVSSASNPTVAAALKSSEDDVTRKTAAQSVSEIVPAIGGATSRFVESIMAPTPLSAAEQEAKALRAAEAEATAAAITAAEEKAAKAFEAEMESARIAEVEHGEESDDDTEVSVDDDEESVGDAKVALDAAIEARRTSRTEEEELDIQQSFSTGKETRQDTLGEKGEAEHSPLPHLPVRAKQHMHARDNAHDSDDSQDDNVPSSPSSSSLEAEGRKKTPSSELPASAEAFTELPSQPPAFGTKSSESAPVGRRRAQTPDFGGGSPLKKAQAPDFGDATSSVAKGRMQAPDFGPSSSSNSSVTPSLSDASAWVTGMFGSAPSSTSSAATEGPSSQKSQQTAPAIGAPQWVTGMFASQPPPSEPSPSAAMIDSPQQRGGIKRTSSNRRRSSSKSPVGRRPSSDAETDAEPQTPEQPTANILGGVGLGGLTAGGLGAGLTVGWLSR